MKTVPDKAVSVIIKWGCLRVYIDGFIHLSVHCDQLIGAQSYNDSGYYCIDYYTKDTGTITSQYYTKKVWQDVLVGLEKVNVI